MSLHFKANLRTVIDTIQSSLDKGEAVGAVFNGEDKMEISDLKAMLWALKIVHDSFGENKMGVVTESGSMEAEFEQNGCPHGCKDINDFMHNHLFTNPKKHVGGDNCGGNSQEQCKTTEQVELERILSAAKMALLYLQDESQDMRKSAIRKLKEIFGTK